MLQAGNRGSNSFGLWIFLEITQIDGTSICLLNCICLNQLKFEGNMYGRRRLVIEGRESKEVLAAAPY